MTKSYQPSADQLFSVLNIRKCQKAVISIQRRMDKAVANNDRSSIRETFNLLAKKSNAVKILATWKITQHNQGKYTAGVDGMAIPKKAEREHQNKLRLEILEDIDILKKPDNIRRVYIPKPNGKKHPLGIPTIHDRIVQEIIRIAIEPIVEYKFNDNSYGFRPKRSCHDAIQHAFSMLSGAYAKRYIIEGDIKGCFDNIKHNHITQILKEWNTPNWALSTINDILKSGIFHNGQVYDSETGTPQGGVISPLLANVALTTLDNFCFENYGYTHSSKGVKSKRSPIVRYADDFIITCKSLQTARQIKSEIAGHLKETTGLTLSEEKTKITHITKGFNFLGFNIRKYPKQEVHKNSDNKWVNYKLLIKPQKEKKIEFLKACKSCIGQLKTIRQVNLINVLNPKLVGWGMYYRHVVSKKVFSQIDKEIWQKCYNWAKRRHPNKPKSWIINKYFAKIGNVKSRFADKETNTKIFLTSAIPIKRFTKVKSGIRVYDGSPETIEYWEKREYTNAYEQIDSVKMRQLYERQRGKCALCDTSLTDEEITQNKTHIHHLIPTSLGGNDNYSNLRLLHSECHKYIHSTLTLNKMKEYTETGIDYVRLLTNKVISNLESRVR